MTYLYNKKKESYFYKIIFIICMLVLSNFIYANKLSTKRYIISDGSRLFFDNKKFSIVPPWGWRVDTEAIGGGLLMLSPLKKGIRHNANIQVLKYNDAIDISSLSNKDIYNRYIMKFLGTHTQVRDLYLHDSLVLEFKEGINGLSFYTSFNLNQEKMMQTFLLVSTINNHFLLSYTDKETYFRDRDVDGSFDEAWQSIASIEFTDAVYKSRINNLLFFIVVAAILIFALLFYSRFRRNKKDYLDDL
jgi:hypothetical protein